LFIELIEREVQKIELKTSMTIFLAVRKFADLIMFGDGLTYFICLAKRK